jgi:uncharacterized membrane protein YfcA
MAILLSAAIGVSLGLLGGGGSVLAVPVLVYVAGVEAKEAVTMSLAIVGSTSLVASLLHQRQGNLDFKVAATFGSAGVAGAFLGAKLTALVSGSVLLLIFAALMLIVGALMLVRKKNEPSPTDEKRRRNPTKTLLVGAGVGVVTGFLGVGGGFLVVPALVLFAGVPMHLAIGTSLLVIAINSAAGFAGHWGQGQLHFTATAAFTLAAVLGTFAGERLAGRISAGRMRQLFAGFVILIALFLMVANRQALW